MYLDFLILCMRKEDIQVLIFALMSYLDRHVSDSDDHLFNLAADLLSDFQSRFAHFDKYKLGGK